MRFDKNFKVDKSPLEELNEMLLLTDQEQKNWKKIQQMYNLKLLSVTEKVA